MAFTKTPSTSKQWKSSQSPPPSNQDLIIITNTKFLYNNNPPFSSSSSKRTKSFIFLFIIILFFFFSLCFTPLLISSRTRKYTAVKNQLFRNNLIKKINKSIKIGFINAVRNEKHQIQIHETLQLLGLSEESTEAVKVNFDILNNNSDWKTLFPEWIDEDENWRSPECPLIPMPTTDLYADLDVVVLRNIPCGTRDVIRLQANLAAAAVATASGAHRTVHVAFVGSCGAMREIFRCDDLVAVDQLIDGDRTAEGVWVYKPEMGRLKQKILMPVGSCQLAPLYARTGREVWRNFMIQKAPIKNNNNNSTQLRRRSKPKEAYVTILHSSEAYVCGAIALAQSILQTNTTKHLLLLADDSISPNSINALRTAGWTIERIHRIRSPFAEKGSYNEWNYSKLRIWQLAIYDKIIFIDADLLVLKKIDHFFALPQLSAVANNKMRFNSGLMVVEPSACLFEDMMAKSFELESYNGGDQGFLNEIFTWWHRLPSKINHLKMFEKDHNNESSDDPYAIHYLGLKPWMCYKDYDCNWDMADHHVFASDSAHAKWWKVYDAMPTELQHFCGLTKKMDSRIRKWRKIAKNNATFPDAHWKIKITDPRRHRFMDNQY